jgi:hypothetical protein
VTVERYAGVAASMLRGLWLDPAGVDEAWVSLFDKIGDEKKREGGRERERERERER